MRVSRRFNTNEGENQYLNNNKYGKDHLPILSIKNMSYSFLLTLKKVIKQLIIAALSIIAAGLVSRYPDIASFNVFGGFTVFALLNMLADYLKHRWGFNL